MHSPTSNRLLDALPPDEFERLRPQLALIALPLGQAIHAPGVHQQSALFPTTCILSLHCVMASGASAETAAVGNEGMVGVALITGAGSSASSCTVQTAGQAWRLDGSLLKQAFREHGTLRWLLLRYLHSLINQTMLTAACHRHHSIDQQLSRCLLMTADRRDAAAPVMTQGLVASVLGVSPDSIALAAGKLQAAGFISYRRGHLAMLDRKGLESVVCECYAVDKREQARLRSAERPRRSGAERETAPARC